MSKILEFYFDFGSPTAYLAHKRLKQLREKYGLTIDYKPMLLGECSRQPGIPHRLPSPPRENTCLNTICPASRSATVWN